MAPEELVSWFSEWWIYVLKMSPFASILSYSSMCIKLHRSGSIKLLNMDPIRIRIHNTAFYQKEQLGIPSLTGHVLFCSLLLFQSYLLNWELLHYPQFNYLLRYSQSFTSRSSELKANCSLLYKRLHTNPIFLMLRAFSRWATWSPSWSAPAPASASTSSTKSSARVRGPWKRPWRRRPSDQHHHYPTACTVMQQHTIPLTSQQDTLC